MASPPRLNARKPWTQEESGLLEQLIAAGTPTKLIAERFGRSVTAVTTRAAKLGISIAESGTGSTLERKRAQ